MKGRIIATATLLTVFGGYTPAAQAGGDPYIGEVMWTGANYCPRGWAEANGAVLAISGNEALFSLFGTVYGGDGRTTFSLPDLRGRSSVHLGRGYGLSDNIRQGELGGGESVALTPANMPSHVHSLSAATVTLHANSNAGDSPEPQARMLADGQRAAVYAEAPVEAVEITSLAAQSASVGGNTDATGSGTPIAMRSPYLGMRACIALVGLFPSRS